MSTKRRFAATAGAVAFLVALTGCSAGGSPTGGDREEIWYSTKNSSELVHVAMADGVLDAAKSAEYKGEVTVAESDAAKQNDQMNNLVLNLNPAAIVVNPYDSDSISDVIERAVEKNIPVAVIDNKANNAKADVSVLFDSPASGEIAGEKAIELLTERYGTPKGVVVNLQGDAVSQVARDRAKGFEDVIAQYPDVELIPVVGAQAPDKATSAINSVIADLKSSGKTIDLVNSPTDPATLGAIEALKTNGLWTTNKSEEHVFVISHDGLGEILDLVREGYVDAEVVVDIYGVGGIATEILAQYPLKGKDVPTSGTFTPKGSYLNTEVTFTKGDSGPTVLLQPIIVDASDVDNPLIWGNASE